MIEDIQQEQADHQVKFKGKQTKDIFLKSFFFLLLKTPTFFHMLCDIICNILYNLRIQECKNQNYFIIGEHHWSSHFQEDLSDIKLANWSCTKLLQNQQRFLSAWYILLT